MILAYLCLTLLCSWNSQVPALCETLADHEQGEPIDDGTDTGVGCVDDCLEPMKGETL